MNSRNKILIVIVVMIIGSAILFITGNTDQSDMMMPKGDETNIQGLNGEVKIGLLLPLTGDYANQNVENWEASKFAVDEFNKYLVERGEPWYLKMTTEDTQTSPVQALEKLTSLKAKGINVVIGPAASASVSHIKGYADSNNMMLVSCCSTAPSLAIPDDSVYRIIPDDTNQGAALAKLFVNEGIETIIVVWRADTWGDGLAMQTSSLFEELGGKAVDGIRYSPDIPEFSSSASLLAEIVQTNVEQYGADKVGIMYIGFSEAFQFMQSASGYDILGEVRWFGSDVTTNDQSIVDDPIASKFANGVRLTSVQAAAASTDNLIYDKVETYMREKLGKTPNTYVYSSYDAVWLVGKSMLETDSDDINEIKKVISQVAGKYRGAMGVIKLNDAGDLAQADYGIWGIRDGQWVALGVYNSAQDTIDLG